MALVVSRIAFPPGAGGGVRDRPVIPAGLSGVGATLGHASIDAHQNRGLAIIGLFQSMKLFHMAGIKYRHIWGRDHPVPNTFHATATWGRPCLRSRATRSVKGALSDDRETIRQPQSKIITAICGTPTLIRWQ
jgi:hypothetical protein